MPTTIRTSDVREVLALVPFQLGFQPVESAVLVGLRGARSQVGLVARVDLARLAAPDDGGHTARSVVGHLAADGARRAVAIVYTEEDLQRWAWGTAPGTGAPPADDDLGDAARASAAREAVAALWQAALDALGDLETWVVGPRGYYALGCPDPGCCPPGGRPLTDLQSTRVGAQMVLEGLLVAPTRDDLVRFPVTTPTQRKAARRAADRWRARGAAAAPGAASHRWRREGLTLWRQAMGALLTQVGPRSDDGTVVPAAPPAAVVGLGGPSPLPEATVTGRLLAALEDVLVRDAVLISFVEGNDRVADRLVAGESGPSIGRALAAITDPVRGRRPDPARAAAARAVLEHAVAHASRGRHAPALTLLAVLAWWEGDGARAGLLADRALAADSSHRLALLVDQALRAGMPPGWARSDRAC